MQLVPNHNHYIDAEPEPDDEDDYFAGSIHPVVKRPSAHAIFEHEQLNSIGLVA